MGCGASTQSRKVVVPTDESVVPAAHTAPFFSPAALLASVESGAIRSMKGSWIIELHGRGGTLSRRQDLPEEAFWKAWELRELIDKIGMRHPPHDVHGEIGWGLLFVALSYRWLTAQHPDPEGFHLERVAKAARLYMKPDDEWGSPLIALFRSAGLSTPDFALFWECVCRSRSPDLWVTPYCLRLASPCLLLTQRSLDRYHSPQLWLALPAATDGRRAAAVGGAAL